MFEYTCPKCHQTTTIKTIESGKVAACANCGQRLRVVGGEDAGPGLSLSAAGMGDAPSAGGWGAPLMVVGSGLCGVALACAIVLTWNFRNSKASEPAADKTVAQKTSAAKAEGASAKSTDAPKKNSDATPAPKKETETAKGDKDGSPSPAATVLTDEQVYQRLLKSCVWVVTEDGHGSGAVVDREQRLVLTNEHVANERSSTVLVVFPAYKAGKLITENAFYLGQIKNRMALAGKVVRVDRKRDLVLIQLPELPPSAVPLRLAGRSVSPGQKIHTVGGNPEGNTGQWIYSNGSVRQVSFKQWHYADNFTRAAEVIASQVPINHGDSGAPVVDARGVLVGVNALGSGGQLNSGHIDVSEVGAFLKSHFTTIGKEWTQPAEAPAETVAVEDLRKLLDDLRAADARIRKRAAVKLAEFGPAARHALPDLLKALRKPDEVADVRAAILAALGEIGPSKDHVTLLIEALEDGAVVAARVYAADALGKLGAQAKPAVPALIKAVQDPESDVRRAVVGSLARIGRVTVPGEVKPTLYEALKDKERDVRMAAANALLGMGAPDPADAPALTTMLADRSGSREGRVYAVWALGELGAQHIPALADAASNDPDTSVVHLAIEALGTLKAKTKESGQALAKAVGHAQARIRMTAASALGQIGLDATTIPGIVRAVGSKDLACRKAVLDTLPPTGAFVKDPPRLNLSKDIVGDLTPGLDSEDPVARALAAYLLGALGADAASAVPALRKAVAREKNPVVQREMLCAFAEIGPEAKEAVPELKEIMDDTSKEKVLLQRCAALALVRMAEKEEGKTAYAVLARAIELPPLQPPAPQVQFNMGVRTPRRPIRGLGIFGGIGGMTPGGRVAPPGVVPPQTVRKRDPIEEAIHDRAKKALSKGKKLAASALVHAYQDSFIGREEEKRTARKTTLEVLAKIGPDAKSMSLYRILNTLTRAEKLGQQLDFPEVLQAAKEAMTAIYRTK